MQEVVEEQEIPEANSLMWYIGVRTHTHIYIYTWLYWDVIYIRTHIFIYIYTHMYTHIYIYMGGFQNHGPFLGYPKY